LPDQYAEILTDNGKEFTGKLFASRKRQATGNHAFDQLCFPPLVRQMRPFWGVFCFYASMTQR